MIRLGKRFSTSTPGDPQFYGGKPPFMPAVLPIQSWQWLWAENTQAGRTGTDDRDAPILRPILFALHGLKLSQKGMSLPVKGNLPPAWQSEGSHDYGRTDPEFKQSVMLKPLIFAIDGFGMGMGKGKVLRPLPAPPENPGPSLTIQGITKDKVGNPVACSTVYLFNVTSGIPVLVKTATSDGSGLYSFTVEEGQIYWVTDYKTGTPDKTGATLNTLTGGTLVDVFAYDPTGPQGGPQPGVVLFNISSGSLEMFLGGTNTLNL